VFASFNFLDLHNLFLQCIYLGNHGFLFIVFLIYILTFQILNLTFMWRLIMYNCCFLWVKEGRLLLICAYTVATLIKFQRRARLTYSSTFQCLLHLSSLLLRQMTHGTADWRSIELHRALLGIIGCSLPGRWSRSVSTRCLLGIRSACATCIMLKSLCWLWFVKVFNYVILGIIVAVQMLKGLTLNELWIS